MNTIIYDCEIIKCIPTGEKKEKYEYCNGWGDYENMGISVIGVWCSGFGGFERGLHSFVNEESKIPAELETFKKMLEKTEMIIGFNSIAFDDKLCKANGIDIKTNYDLLEKVRVASGQPAKYKRGITRGGYKLEAIARANLGEGKSGTGELAPELWQDGRREEVVEYCLRDVDLTRRIWEMRDSLKDPTTGEILVLG